MSRFFLRIATQLKIDRLAKETITSQIVRHLVAVISDGRIPFGTKLPSIRDLSDQLHVSCTSIVHAYEQLVDTGYVVSRPGSGFFASHQVSFQKNLPHNDTSQPVPAITDSPLESFLLGQTGALATQVQLELGRDYVPQSIAALEDLRAAARGVFLNGASLADSRFDAFGHSDLLAHYYEELVSRGIPLSLPRPCEPSALVVAQGMQESLAILFSVLAVSKPFCGDASTGPRPICIEDPAPLFVHAAAIASRLPLVSIQRSFNGLGGDYSGLDWEVYLRKTRPSVVVTMPNFQDPHGGVLTPFERTKLIALAAELDFYIVEVDAFPSLFFGEVFQTPIAALDGLNRSVYVFSQAHLFSSLFKGAVICARPSLAELLAEKQLLGFGQPSILEQYILADFFSKGHNKRHMLRMQNLFRERRDSLIGMLRRMAPHGSRWTVPLGGIFLWFEFPGGAAAHEIYAAARERGVILHYGNLFSLSRMQPHAMRINFAAFEPAQTFGALETVFALWRHHSG